MNEVNQIKEKQIAALKALEFIKSGMVVGLGTGSTVKFMIEGLAVKVKNGLNIKTVSTSAATRILAESLGIRISELNEVNRIDLTIDGADEVDPQLNGIKGGGGALLYEKIVASNSKKNIWVVDSSKYVKELGKFPLPVEVLPFGSEQIFNKFNSSGYRPGFRMRDDKFFVTDGNHYIIDLHLTYIEKIRKLNAQLKSIPGVIETGLFIDICDILIVGRKNECEMIFKNEKDRLS